MSEASVSQGLTDMQNAGQELVAQGRLAEAAALYLAALEGAPGDPDLLYEYGEILFKLGRLEEAADTFRRLLADTPQDPACIIMLARMLHRLKNPRESLHYFRMAQRLAPHLAAVHLMAGVTAMESGLRDEARVSFARALELDPDDTSSRLCLCMTLLKMYSSEVELEEGRRSYTQSLNDLARNTRLDTPAAIDKAVDAVEMMLPFFLPYQGRNDRDLQRIYGEWVSRIMAAKFPQYGRITASMPVAGEKLRVGFVSGHHCDHSVWKIITRGWLEHLDRNRFMVFAYYTGDKCDHATEEARRHSDAFVRETDVAVLAETIHRHRPHVLIYPGIGMDPHTFKLAALRLAPVQCASWGHPVTTGLPTMDYFLSSDLMEPPDGNDHYTERLVRLPHLSVCYAPLPQPPDLPEVSIPGVECGDVSFLCCQNLVKYLPQHDDVFPAIASRVARAKFVFIKYSEPHYLEFSRRMEAAFARLGLSASDHVVFVPPLNGIGYAAMNAAVDIYLDSIGWSGGNTTFEALPFDKPVVTLPGEFMRGRHSAAILRMMGVEETIASDKDDYVDIAVRLANDGEWRAAVSAHIAAEKHRAYSDKECVAALENFLRHAVFNAQYHTQQQEAVQTCM